MGDLRLISHDTLDDCLDMPAVIDAIEDAFADFAAGKATMPPKSYLELPEFNGDYRAMPAQVGDSAGVKWVNVHPDNPKEHSLPTVMGTVIYGSAETGEPQAIMDGTVLTRYRTGAVSGIAAKHLAPRGSNTLGIIGAGEQAHAQLDAIAAVLDLDQVVISDVDSEAVERFISRELDRDMALNEGSPKEAASCDVVSTTTPVSDPIVKDEWIDGDTHVNAIGADAAHKQEYELGVIKRAAIIVDEWEQCSHGGEISQAVDEGLVTEESIHGTLPELVAGEVDAVRDGVTVFDSTGIAIQDMATARLAHKKAVERDLGETFDLVQK